MGTLSHDGRLLFATRLARLFAYGFLAIVLVLYLAQAGLSEASIGLLLTLTLIGDTVISLWLTTRADRFGRRRTLMLGTGLMIFAALLFANTQEFIPLLIAATIGVISPSGNEVGPFCRAAALSRSCPIASARASLRGITSPDHSPRRSAHCAAADWRRCCKMAG
jgi:MFS family permease